MSRLKCFIAVVVVVEHTFFIVLKLDSLFPSDSENNLVCPEAVSGIHRLKLAVVENFSYCAVLVYLANYDQFCKGRFPNVMVQYLRISDAKQPHHMCCIFHTRCPGPGGGGGGEGVLLGILGGGVPPGSSNPNPISDLNMPFSTPVFRPDL